MRRSPGPAPANDARWPRVIDELQPLEPRLSVARLSERLSAERMSESGCLERGRASQGFVRPAHQLADRWGGSRPDL